MSQFLHLSILQLQFYLTVSKLKTDDFRLLKTSGIVLIFLGRFLYFCHRIYVLYQLNCKSGSIHDRNWQREIECVQEKVNNQNFAENSIFFVKVDFVGSSMTFITIVHKYFCYFCNEVWNLMS